MSSYCGSSFLNPKGKGGSNGYDTVVALPANGKRDEEDLAKENIKNTASSTGKITLSVTQSKPKTREVIVVFKSLQPSNTNMGLKTPKDVQIQGIWYAQLDSQSSSHMNVYLFLVQILPYVEGTIKLFI